MFRWSAKGRPKRVQVLADRLRELCSEQRVVLMPAQARDIITDSISETAFRLGVTERTVTDRYMTDQHLRALVAALAQANAETLDAISSADAVTLPRIEAAGVVAAIGMCLKLAIQAAAAKDDHTGVLGAATDATDAVTGLGAALAADDGSTSVTLDSYTTVYAGRVITATVNNLHSADWACPCNAPHTDARCSLQRSLIMHLASIGGWVAQWADVPPKGNTLGS